MSKHSRQRLSGAAYINTRLERAQEYQQSATIMQTFLSGGEDQVELENETADEEASAPEQGW